MQALGVGLHQQMSERDIPTATVTAITQLGIVAIPVCVCVPLYACTCVCTVCAQTP